MEDIDEALSLLVTSPSGTISLERFLNIGSRTVVLERGINMFSVRTDTATVSLYAPYIEAWARDRHRRRMEARQQHKRYF
jgi:hypothetical protein